jgi:hypothetical protein
LVEGAHGVSADLGAVTGGSERGRRGGPRWLNDGKHGGAVAAKRRRRKNGVVPLGVVAALKLRVPQSGCGRSLKVVGVGKHRYLNRATDEWAQAVLDFSNLSKTGSTLKIKVNALPCTTNSQFLHVASLGYYEKISQLHRHEIPNRNRVKNPGTDSTFECLRNFKRDLNHLEKSDKFSKIPS